MTNVIHFMRQKQTGTSGIAGLSAMFANHRRAQGDVYWLKENAEWLGILASRRGDVPDAAVMPYEAFYASIPGQLEFFPQYYRFFLSLCLDLEDLGLGDAQGEALCEWVAQRGLPQAELSDLQRAEAVRLLARRGAGREDPALVERLHGFMARPETFALPNKKAAYELAHIVFYLSDYGRRDPALGKAAIRSLEYAGILAFLDQNTDLLAEICAALRFAGATPSPVWERLICTAHGHCTFSGAAQGQLGDGYHGYLVTGWLAQLTGEACFSQAVPAGQVTIFSAPEGLGPLRQMSEIMFEMGANRSTDWSKMRRSLMADLSPEDQGILEAAEHSISCFDTFFEGFARAGGHSIPAFV